MLNQNETIFATARELKVLKKAAEILAKIEVNRGRRGDTAATSPEVTKRMLRTLLSGQKHESFVVLMLDSQHRLLQKPVELFRGTIDGASVYPREVVHEVLRCNAAAVIFAHNHPSGVGEPSLADRQITRRLTDALSLVDVRVLDHMIVGEPTPSYKDGVISFAERGLI